MNTVDPYTSSDFMLVPATSVGAGPPSVNIRTDRPDKEWWGMDIPPNTNKIAYITIPGPKLKDEDAKALRNGKSALCAVAKTVWRDDTGCYATELFKCLVAETKDTANWRSGGNDGKSRPFRAIRCLSANIDTARCDLTRRAVIYVDMFCVRSRRSASFAAD